MVLLRGVGSWNLMRSGSRSLGSGLLARTRLDRQNPAPLRARYAAKRNRIQIIIVPILIEGDFYVLDRRGRRLRVVWQNDFVLAFVGLEYKHAGAGTLRDVV